ncbi:MAG TPA: hypothetical protein VMK65_06070 [Longimicrobiales bacterium]|nr:hypothetical protein [Longimicrobiales bacterium]
MNRRRIRSAALAALSTLAAAGGLGAQELADYDYENLAFRGIGVDVGRIWPNKVEATQAWGLRFDLGYLGPGVRLVPTLSFWSSRMKEAELSRLADQINQLDALQEQGARVSGADLGPIEWSDLSLGLEGHYVWITPVRLLTYLGAGLAVHGLNGQGDAIADTFVEDLLDSMASGAVLLGGLEYPLMDRFRVYAEARYTILSDLHYSGLKIGGAVMLPSRSGEETVVGGAAGGRGR